MKRPAKIDDSAEARRVADHMEQAGQPISVGDACEALGIPRHHAGYTLSRLKTICGARLVLHGQQSRITRADGLYTITPLPGVERRARPRIYPPRTVPKDLWRGWINPATGIIPPRLGVDLPPRATSSQA